MWQSFLIQIIVMQEYVGGGLVEKILYVSDNSEAIIGSWKSVVNVRLEFLHLAYSELKMKGTELNMTAQKDSLDTIIIKLLRSVRKK